jgi:hypothetical protein
MGDLMREVLESPLVLMVNRDASTVTFTDGDGYVRKYTTNGKTEKHQMPSGTVETKMKWAGQALVLETTVERMLKVTKTYTMEPDPRRLVVLTEMGGRRGGDAPPPLKAVYDEGPPPEAH